MKRIIALSAALLLTLSLFAQNGKALYNRYAGTKDVSCVYISPAMFKIIGTIPGIELKEGEVDLTPVIRSLRGLYIVNSENPDVSYNLLRDAMDFVESGDFELMMEAIDGGETVHIYTCGTETEINNFILISSEGNECSFICLDGRMSRDRLEEMIADSMGD